MESTVAPQPQLTREDSGTLLAQTMGLVAVTAGLFALGASASLLLAVILGYLRVSS